MAMAQASRITKLESQDIALNLPAQKCHEMFTVKVNQTPKACPHRIHSIEVVEGQPGKQGCSVFSQYADPNGSNKVLFAREIMDIVDDEKMLSTFTMVEGDLLNVYKSFRSVLKVNPKADGGSLAKWSVEYEKKNEDSPDADFLISFLVDYTKEVDAYFSDKA